MSSGPSSSYESILYDVADGVATITLNRPEKLNAFNAKMLSEILDALDKVDADDDVRALIVAGAGRGFCAGADLSGGSETFSKGVDNSKADSFDRDGGGLLTLRLYDLKKFTIAAINGPAVGVGIAMTLPMDVRMMSTAAKVGFVHVRRAIMPEAASTWFLPRVVGISKALEWGCTGRLIMPDEALAGGLVRSIHTPEELLPAAFALAHEVADNAAPVSVAVTRQAMWRLLGSPHPMDGHRVDSRGVRFLARLDDAAEGVNSFFEKRPPRFTGKPSQQLPNTMPWWEEPEFS
jgi:enoyl-CoA hydratase/carnithine racemase